MAYTAHDNDDQEKEYFENEKSLDDKVTALAKLIKNSKHFIAFTGAGISTSCGIPDFRSGLNTVLDTGAGKWAKQAAQKKAKKEKEKAKTINNKLQKDAKKKKKKKKSSLKAVPSLTHMSLVALNEEGLLKCLISQNTDGLHRRSGFDIDCLDELHGNGNLEVCRNKNCKIQYFRDFRTRNKKGHNHKTGRNCTKCSGHLYDTIINFNENLPDDVWNDASENADKADLCLAMGSSLTVTPAADLPSDMATRDEKPGDLVVVNLQKTPLDKYCKLRIFAKTDDVMSLLMQKLDLPIPKWNLCRILKIFISDDSFASDDERDIFVFGVDRDGTMSSIFEAVKFIVDDKKDHSDENGNNDDDSNASEEKKEAKVDDDDRKMDDSNDEKYLYCEKRTGANLEKVMFHVDTAWLNSSDMDVTLSLSFMGHYKEPVLNINLKEYLKQKNNSDYDIVLKILYDVQTRQWNVPCLKDQLEDDDVAHLLDFKYDLNEKMKKLQIKGLI